MAKNPHRVSSVAAAFATVSIAAAVLANPSPSLALDNDLAKTPPMGWNSWNQVRCYELTEDVVKAAADGIVNRGLKEKGYEYVVVDDCYQGGRDASGKLYSHPERFPSGMKALADYVHSKGLKFGIYSVPGSKTCANRWDNYPITGLGSLGHEQQDAQTFAEWGVDYLKYDWCDADTNDGLKQQDAFAKMRDELKAVGRPIVYGISQYGMEPYPWLWAEPVANLWRTTHDIQPTWNSVVGIINSQAPLHRYSKPGAWNDPDMLQIGNRDFKTDEARNRTHFGMWAMLAAPLFMGTDINALDAKVVDIVTNPRIIAIDQDAAGKQARRISNRDGVQVWARPLSNGDLAVAVMNTTGATVNTTVQLADITEAEHAWVMTNQWTGEKVRNIFTSFDVSVGAQDTAIMRLAPGFDEEIPGAVEVAGRQTLERGETGTLQVRIVNGTGADLEGLTLTLGEQQVFTAPVAAKTGIKVAGLDMVTVALPVTVKDDAALGEASLPVRLEGLPGGEVTGKVAVRIVPPAPNKDTHVSDLTFTDSQGGWQNTVNRDRSQDGNLLTVAGTTYDKGVGLNAPGTFAVWLGGNCTRLVGSLGVDDETNGGSDQWGHPSIGGTIVKEPDAAGEPLWRSTKVIRYQEREDFDIDVTGVETLRFNTDIGGDTNAYDHADWLKLKLTCAPPPPVTPSPTETTTPGETTGPTETTTPGETTGPTETTTPGETTGPTETTTPGPGETATPTPGETTGPTETTTPGPGETTTPGKHGVTDKPAKSLPTTGSAAVSLTIAAFVMGFAGLMLTVLARRRS